MRCDSGCNVNLDSSYQESTSAHYEGSQLIYDLPQAKRFRRMILRHVKESYSACLVWVLSEKLNYLVRFRIFRAQVSSSEEENGCQNYIMVIDTHLYGAALERKKKRPNRMGES
ncbi:hypothetical protein TNCV_1184141 [Trichonephila clavipes]|nr:hypothetical protein TNCV_1184141 [Trichonephila clavipes]